jgi:hypothetical protein
MSDRSRWHIPQRVEINGQPWNPLKSVLFLAGFVGLCVGIVAWRAVTGGK